MSLSIKIQIKLYMAEWPKCKIPRKFVHPALLLGTALTCWIYWKSNAAFKETPINWDFVINVSMQPFPTPCQSNTFLVIIVTSYVGHVEERMVHRTIIIPDEELRKINATRVFLLAQIPEQDKKITQTAVNNESKTFGDILQGTFIENYKNLTYKHLMGMKWASTACQDASFILKIDDDTVFNLERTYEMLKSINDNTRNFISDDTRNFIMGYVNVLAKPLRKKGPKWYLSWDEYPMEEFPPYLAGWYYITTPRVAAALCAEAIHHPYFWIDDVFVTGILAEPLDIELIQKPPEYSLENFVNCYCCAERFDGVKQFDCRNPVIH